MKTYKEPTISQYLCSLGTNYTFIYLLFKKLVDFFKQKGTKCQQSWKLNQGRQVDQNPQLVQ